MCETRLEISILCNSATLRNERSEMYCVSNCILKYPLYSDKYIKETDKITHILIVVETNSL